MNNFCCLKHNKIKYLMNYKNINLILTFIMKLAKQFYSKRLNYIVNNNYIYL